MSTPYLRLIHHTEILEERAGTVQTLNLINNFRKIFFFTQEFFPTLHMFEFLNFGLRIYYNIFFLNLIKIVFMILQHWFEPKYPPAVKYCIPT